jgi:hypothetical protein
MWDINQYVKTSTKEGNKVEILWSGNYSNTYMATKHELKTKMLVTLKWREWQF